MTTEAAKEILANSPSNDGLAYIICESFNKKIINQAWKLLIANNPSNDKLAYIIRYCSEKEIINQACKLLIANSPSNDGLAYIIRSCSDKDIINQAWQLLIANDPSNYKLSYIIEYCSDKEIINQATKLLLPQAKEIALKYDFKLIPKWKGKKMVWHMWHSEHKVYAMAYPEYIVRLVEINDDKPENEKPQRYAAIKMVKGEFKENLDEWKSNKNDAWELKNIDLINKYHSEECKHCGWDKKQNEMIF